MTEKANHQMRLNKSSITKIIRFLSKILPYLIFPFAATLAYTASAKASEPLSQDIPYMQELQVGDIAPFDGMLLNPAAQASILATKKKAEEECKLDMDYMKEKIQLKAKLELDNCNSELKIETEKYETIMNIKDEEISRLQDLAFKSVPSDTYEEWWYAGGVVTGIVLTVVVLFIFEEVFPDNITLKVD